MTKFVKKFNQRCETHQITDVKKASDDKECFVMLFNRTLQYNNGKEIEYFSQIFDEKMYVVKKGNKTHKFLICINVPRASWCGITAVGMELFRTDRQKVIDILEPLLKETFPKAKGYIKTLKRIN